jgi:Tol biopolymer transport system component
LAGVQPSTPNLYPIENSDGDGRYLVDWSDATGATSYELQEDDNPEFTNPTIRYNSPDSQYEVRDQIEGNWYYRVRSSNAGGNSPWSNTESVVVIPSTPTPTFTNTSTITPTLTSTPFQTQTPTLTPTRTVHSPQIAFQNTLGGVIWTSYAPNWPVELLISSPQGKKDWGPAWSPDGTKIAFQNNYGDLYVWDGTYLDRITHSDMSSRTLPSWSPDGSSLAYEFWDSADSQIDIYTINIYSGNPKNLTGSDNISETEPKWSPNGSQIMFSSTNGIGTVHPDGSNYKILTNGVLPSWSPDGSKIVFYHSGEIYTMNSDGSNIQRLTNNFETDIYPSWSPDGQYIAFSSTRDGDSDIFVMKADGSNQVNITYTASWYETTAIWSPDSSMLAIEGHTIFNNSSTDIFIYNLDGSNPIHISTSMNIELPCWRN